MRKATVAAAVAALSLAAAPLAAAANHDAVCQQGEVCLYNGQNFGEVMSDNYNAESDWRGVYFYLGSPQTNINDKVQSYFNNASGTVCLYRDIGFSGTPSCVGSFTSKTYQDLVNDGLWFSGSSHKWVSF